jgi:polygalacturonase
MAAKSDHYINGPMKKLASLIILIGIIGTLWSAQQLLDFGSAANDGTGTPLRNALQLVESNFTELYSQNAHLVSITDAQFGAVADDGISDETAIQTALDYATNFNGLTVLVPPGEFLYTQGLDIHSNTELLLAGTLKVDWSNSSTNSGTARHHIQAAGSWTAGYDTDGRPTNFIATNITIRGINGGGVDGDSLNCPLPTFANDGARIYPAHAFQMVGVTNLVIDGVTIDNAVGFSIGIRSSQNVLIQNNVINGGNGHNSPLWDGKNNDGIHPNDSWDVQILNNFIRTTDDAIAVGILDTNSASKNIIVAGNITTNVVLGPSQDSSGNTNYYTGAYGLKVVFEAAAAANPNKMENLTVIGNNFRGGAGNIAQISSGRAIGLPAFENVIYQNNILADAITAFDQTTITSALPVASYAVRLENGHNIKFAHNIITNTARIPISLLDGRNIDIHQNTITGVETNVNIATDDHSTIRMRATFGSLYDTRITENRLHGSVASSIWGTVGTETNANLFISGNIITDNSEENSDAAKVNSYASIYLLGATDPVIKGNTLNGGNATGINVVDAVGHVVVSGNFIRNLGDGSMSGVEGLLLTQSGATTLDNAYISRNRVFDVDGRGFNIDDVEQVDIVDNVLLDLMAVSGTEGILMTWDNNVADGAGTFMGNRIQADGTEKALRADLDGKTYTGQKIVLMDNQKFGTSSSIAFDTVSASTAFQNEETTQLSIINEFTESQNDLDISTIITNGNAINISLVPTSSSAARGINIAMSTNSVGDAILIDNNGTSYAIRVAQDGVLGAGVQALQVASTVAQTTSPLARIYSANASTTQDALQAWHLGTGDAVNVNHDGATGNAIEIDRDGNSANDTDVIGLRIVADNAGAGTPIGVDMSGMAADEPLISLPTDTTAGVDATIRCCSLY